VARTSNNRVIAARDLYCCLLPQCEALHTCRSGFPIATVSLQKIILRGINLENVQAKHGPYDGRWACLQGSNSGGVRVKHWSNVLLCCPADISQHLCPLLASTSVLGWIFFSLVQCITLCTQLTDVQWHFSFISDKF